MNFSKWLRSSQDPTKISESIKGGVTAVSALLIFVALQVFGLEVTQADILELGTYLGTIVGAILGLKGLIMKFVVAMGTDKTE